MNIDLDAIQARADAATRGPWEIKTEDRDTPSVWHDQEVAFSIGRCADCGVEAEYETADAEFIAAARTDVPALLVLVRDLEARVERGLAACDRVLNNEDGHKPPGPPHPTQQQATAVRIRAALTATDAS